MFQEVGQIYLVWHMSYVVNVYVSANRLVSHMQELTTFLVIFVMDLYLRTIHYLVIMIVMKGHFVYNSLFIMMMSIH